MWYKSNKTQHVIFSVTQIYKKNFKLFYQRNTLNVSSRGILKQKCIYSIFCSTINNYNVKENTKKKLSLPFVCEIYFPLRKFQIIKQSFICQNNFRDSPLKKPFKNHLFQA